MAFRETAGMTPRTYARLLIEAERNVQNARFPNESNTPDRWYVILGEEFGEVGRSILENEERDRLTSELVQVAAVAQAWIEDLHRGK